LADEKIVYKKMLPKRESYRLIFGLAFSGSFGGQSVAVGSSFAQKYPN